MIGWPLDQCHFGFMVMVSCLLTAIPETIEREDSIWSVRLSHRSDMYMRGPLMPPPVSVPQSVDDTIAGH